MTERGVYIVEHGEYSDRHVVAVFTEQARADTLAAACGETAEVTYYPLDIEVVYPVMPRFEVKMQWDGTVTRCTPLGQVVDDQALLVPLTLECYAYDTEIMVQCFAHDQAHAIKIANEQRLMKKVRREELEVAAQFRPEHMPNGMIIWHPQY